MRQPDPERRPTIFPDGDRMVVQLPADLVEQVARRAVELMEAREAPPEPWVGVERAAEHLACPRSRIYALVGGRRVPHRRDGTRLLFRLSELDAWLERGGGTRP